MGDVFYGRLPHCNQAPALGNRCILQSLSFQVRVSGIVQIDEDSGQGKAKPKAEMKRKGTDGKVLI